MDRLPETVWPIFSDLRRYASALTGDRRMGDWYTRITLETLLQEPFRVRADGDVRFQLFKLRGDALSVDGVVSVDAQDETESDDVLKRGLLALPLLTRHLFLLVTLEGFSVRRAAELLGMAKGEAESFFTFAREQMRDQLEMPSDTAVSDARAQPAGVQTADTNATAIAPRQLEIGRSAFVQ
jgi:hypothetical protein